jgi:hypothetical protein
VFAAAFATAFATALGVVKRFAFHLRHKREDVNTARVGHVESGAQADRDPTVLAHKSILGNSLLRTTMSILVSASRWVRRAGHSRAGEERGQESPQKSVSARSFNATLTFACYTSAASAAGLRRLAASLASLAEPWVLNSLGRTPTLLGCILWLLLFHPSAAPSGRRFLAKTDVRRAGSRKRRSPRYLYPAYTRPKMRLLGASAIWQGSSGPRCQREERR